MPAFVLFLFLGMGPFAWAITVTPDSVQLSLESAELVADIFIEDLAIVSDPGVFAKRVARAEILNIHHQTLNKRAHEKIEIEALGGEERDVGVFYSGLPRPLKNHRYKAFLIQKENVFHVVGFEKGLVSLEEERSSSQNRVDGPDGVGTGAYLHWEDRFFPLPYYIAVSSFLGRWGFVEAIDQSFSAWQTILGSKVGFIGMGCAKNGAQQNDGINTIVFIEDRWDFDPSIIALTRNFYLSQTSTDAGLILDSDILINGVHHDFSIDNKSGTHDVQNIITHEIGHVLGMGHEISPADVDATMFAVATTGETKKRTLESNDRLGLLAFYEGTGEKIEYGIPSCEIDNNLGCAIQSTNSKSSKGMLALCLILLSVLGIRRSLKVLF